MSPAWAAAGGVLGLVAGSFVGALVARWPRGESVARGRSRCDACGRTLASRELVPLLSFVLQRGRCRACGAPIARDHLVAELGGLMVGASAAWFASDWPAALAGALLGWTLLALALLDARHLWLPDRLTLSLLAAGLAVAALGPGPTLAESALTAAAAYALLELLRRGFRALRGREGLGGGDPKLFAALGAWLGAEPLVWTLLAASLGGLAWAVVRGRAKVAQPLPLGTLLAMAGWPAFVLASAS